MRFLILAIIASTLAAQTASKPGAAPSGNAANGRKIFVSDGCYQCHGREAQGGAAGPRLGPRPVPFVGFSLYVRQPSGQMPPFTPKVVSDQELADIYAFLQSLPQPPAAKNVPLLNQ